jgi:hypothetical protein
MKVRWAINTVVVDEALVVVLAKKFYKAFVKLLLFNRL